MHARQDRDQAPALLVFVPGLGSRAAQTVEALSLKLAHALTRGDESVMTTDCVRFRIEEDSKRKPEHTLVATISARRDDGMGMEPIVDVYRYEYLSTLHDTLERRNILSKAILLLVAAVIFTSFAIWAFITRSGRNQARLTSAQLILASAILSIGALYIFDLFLAVLELLVKAGEEAHAEWIAQLPVVGGLLPYAGAALDWTHRFDWAPAVGAIGAAIWLALRWFGHRPESYFHRMVLEYVAVVFYLTWGLRRDEIRRSLAETIDRLTTQSASNYQRVYIAAYSFGAVVAADFLFPQCADGERDRGTHVARKIGAFISIGFPYEAIRAVWPNYFSNRCSSSALADGWLNIYAPVDVLGSRLEPRHPDGGADGFQVPTAASSECVAPRDQEYRGRFGTKLSDWQRLKYVGFRAHAAYWESGMHVDCTADIAAYVRQSREPAGRHTLSGHDHD
jgi:hypothetical protein